MTSNWINWSNLAAPISEYRRDSSLGFYASVVLASSFLVGGSAYFMLRERPSESAKSKQQLDESSAPLDYAETLAAFEALEKE